MLALAVLAVGPTVLDRWGAVLYLGIADAMSYTAATNAVLSRGMTCCPFMRFISCSFKLIFSFELLGLWLVLVVTGV